MKNFYTNTILILMLLFVSIATNAQNRDSQNITLDSTQIVFKDTIFNFVFDSIVVNLGMIKPTNENNRQVQYFKYIGKEPAVIARPWTGDPHFICDYPKEPLLYNHIYSYTVCFYHQNKQSKLNKKMGFDLSNGNRITLQFIGEYLPQ